MDRWTGKVAVVTGASAGIGLAMAQALVREGLIVVGFARRKTLMEEEMRKLNIKENFYACECDVTDEKSVEGAFQWIKDNLKTVHIRINNAGRGFIGSVADKSFEDLKSVIDTNLTGLLCCTKKAINLMNKDDETHIVNVNSTLGHQVINFPNFPHCNIYPATKFAVRALSETLDISPGFVNTDMIKNSAWDFYKREILEPQDIVHAILFAIGAPSRVQIKEMIITPTKS